MGINRKLLVLGQVNVSFPGDVELLNSRLNSEDIQFPISSNGQILESPQRLKNIERVPSVNGPVAPALLFRTAARRASFVRGRCQKRSLFQCQIQDLLLQRSQWGVYFLLVKRFNGMHKCEVLG
jgi:hypothetical protein